MPGFVAAADTASVTRIERAIPLARIMARRAGCGRCTPSTMKLADRSRSASCANSVLSSFGRICGRPLPRWVDMRAPALTAIATVSALAAECPMATILPASLMARMKASLPGSSGRDRDKEDRLRQRRFEPEDEVGIGRDHHRGRMAARIAVRGVEERPFEVIARHHPAGERALRDRAVERRKAACELIDGGRDESGKKQRHARGEASP